MNPILKLRSAAELSQSELAMRLGVSQSSVSQYERGVIQPGLDQARRLVALSQEIGQPMTLDDVYADDQAAPELATDLSPPQTHTEGEGGHA